MKSIAAALFVTLLALASASAAAAAAGPESPRYVASDPADGAEVSSPPARVTVTFSEPLDSSSSLHVYDECGQAVDSGDTQVLGSRMDVGLARTPSGHYTAVYDAKGFGGATGETKDDFSFHVTSGTACGDGGTHHHHEGGGGEHSGHEGEHAGGHEGHEGTGHEGHTTHEGSGHDAHTGAHGAHPAGEHAAHAGGEHAGHTEGGHESHEDGHQHGGPGLAGVHDLKGGNGGGEQRLVPPRLAAGRGGLAPTSQSVLIALGLSIVMGALGGWVLRASAAS